LSIYFSKLETSEKKNSGNSTKRVGKDQPEQWKKKAGAM